jgi:hypothetical protein
MKFGRGVTVIGVLSGVSCERRTIHGEHSSLELWMYSYDHQEMREELPPLFLPGPGKDAFPLI